jgi:hypothetical protein
LAIAACVPGPLPAGDTQFVTVVEGPAVAGKSPRKSAAKKPAGKSLKEKRSAKKLKNAKRSLQSSQSIVSFTR